MAFSYYDDEEYHVFTDRRGNSVVKVYTDGACFNNGDFSRAQAGIGVYWGRGNENNVSEPIFGSRATNQVAEIQAVCRALDQARYAGMEHLLIVVDTKYVIDCVTKWLDKWRYNGYTRADGGECVNRLDLEVLDEQLQSGEVQARFRYVEAHKGEHGNTQADMLARAGARRYCAWHKVGDCRRRH